MNYYSFHIGDYRGATAHLSNDEDLCYRRLLDMYYDTQKPIPVDTQWVSRRLRVGLDVLENVLLDFFALKQDGWHNTRADKVLDEYIATAEKNRLNGKKGGRPPSVKTRTENPLGSQSVASGNHLGSGIEGNQEPITNNQKPRTKTKSLPLNPPAGEIVYPAGLDTIEFKSVWAEFQQHRLEIKKPLTPTALRNGLLRAADLGLEKAIPALRAAMAAGYSQFYEQQEKLKVNHDHRSEKRSREFTETIEVPDLV